MDIIKSVYWKMVDLRHVCVDIIRWFFFFRLNKYTIVFSTDVCGYIEIVILDVYRYRIVE